MAEHRMHMAKVTRRVARRLGLNTNHHARVWCSCLDDPVSDPGTYAGLHYTVQNPRTRAQAANDPRRLGSYDALGVIDLREANSAVTLFRKHVKESNEAS